MVKIRDEKLRSYEKSCNRSCKLKKNRFEYQNVLGHVLHENHTDAMLSVWLVPKLRTWFLLVSNLHTQQKNQPNYKRKGNIFYWNQIVEPNFRTKTAFSNILFDFSKI